MICHRKNSTHLCTNARKNLIFRILVVKMFKELGMLLKWRGTRGHIANICWITEKAREFQKNIYFCCTDYSKVFDCVDRNKLWKVLKEMEIPDHLTCLLKNLCAGQDATVRTGHGAMDWFHIGKGAYQGCILSPCLLTYMQSSSWEMPGWMKY